MLRGLAIDHDCAVLLLSHPSQTGLITGSGTSGSTAWNNSVRSRLYLEVVDKDPSASVLKVVKANYGPVGEKIDLRWDDGVYGIDNGPDEAVEGVLNRKAEASFL